MHADMTWKLTGIYRSAAYKLFCAVLHTRKPAFKVTNNFFWLPKERSFTSLDSSVVGLQPPLFHPSALKLGH